MFIIEAGIRNVFISKTKLNICTKMDSQTSNIKKIQILSTVSIFCTITCTVIYYYSLFIQKSVLIMSFMSFCIYILPLVNTLILILFFLFKNASIERFKKTIFLHSLNLICLCFYIYFGLKMDGKMQ